MLFLSVPLDTQPMCPQIFVRGKSSLIVSLNMPQYSSLSLRNQQGLVDFFN